VKELALLGSISEFFAYREFGSNLHQEVVVCEITKHPHSWPLITASGHISGREGKELAVPVSISEFCELGKPR
jgi:hypothetical protein